MILRSWSKVAQRPGGSSRITSRARSRDRPAGGHQLEHRTGDIAVGPGGDEALMLLPTSEAARPRPAIGSTNRQRPRVPCVSSLSEVFAVGIQREDRPRRWRGTLRFQGGRAPFVLTRPLDSHSGWSRCRVESAIPSGEYPSDVAVSTSFGSGGVDCT